MNGPPTVFVTRRICVRARATHYARSAAPSSVALAPEKPEQIVPAARLPDHRVGPSQERQVFHISAQAHFFAGVGRGVDRIQDLLHLKRFVRRDERLLSFEGATDEMVNSIFAVGHDRQ